MTKAEKVLEKIYDVLPDGGFDLQTCLTLNPSKNMIISAMEEQSIKFAEFLQNECHYTGAGEYFYLKTHKEHTTSELYKLFNEL